MCEDERSIIDVNSLPGGGKWELEVLGYSSLDFIEKMAYLSFTDYMWNAIFHQPVGYNPRHPTQAMTGILHDGVCAYIPKRWRKVLYLFIGIGTGLDRIHGVDAFFYLNGEIVTLDTTINPSKKHNADFLLTPRNVDIHRRTIVSELMRDISRLLVYRHEQMLAGLHRESSHLSRRIW